MPLGNVWSFPSRALTYQQTLQAMQRLAGLIERISRDCDETAHPIDLNWLLEPLYLKAADQVRIDLGLVEPIPKLCTLVVASAFDAAIHDGFGKANGISCYQGYSERYMANDLGHYLGAEFQGERPEPVHLDRAQALHAALSPGRGARPDFRERHQGPLE